ncbi:6909_t:CDS:2 [Entrophospora sp. SA101]|nr:6909_t:CDS:2 [Entrophospora sp. SA101]
MTENNNAKGEEGELRTVFNDPVNFNVKHPLYNAWTLWFDNPGKKANTVTSELSTNSNYHLFKHGIKPMWEDPENERGGKWVIQFHKNKIEFWKEQLENVLKSIYYCYIE